MPRCCFAVDEPHVAFAHLLHHGPHAAAHHHLPHHAAVEDDLMPRSRRHIRFGQRVGRQVHRPIRHTVPQPVRPVGEIDQTVFQIPVEDIGDGHALSGLAGHVDHQIDTHGRADHHGVTVWCMRCHGLTVQSDHDRRKPPEIQPEYPGIGCVDQPQADAFSGSHGDAVRYLAVDGHGIADTPAVRGVVPTSEICRNLSVAGHPPVIEHPGQIAIYADRVCFLDDQRPVKPASDLFGTALVRVIPERASIQCIEFIEKIATDGDRVLC